MTVQHYFFSSTAPPDLARWREAFPHGQALAPAPALQALNRAPQEDRLVWLSASDTQWHSHLRELLHQRPTERVVLLSDEPHDAEELRALHEGVMGYAHEHAVPQLLRELAVVVAHGGLWVGPQLLRRLVGATQAALGQRPAGAAPSASRAALASLSAREAQVAQQVSVGRSNKEIANLLCITERTVKAHLSAVFEKLGVRDRLQLVLCLAGAQGR